MFHRGVANPKESLAFGAQRVAAGVRFRLWAPSHDLLRVAIEGEAAPIPLTRTSDGWHEVIVPGAAAGARYRILLADGTSVVDPASRFQPDDVHGASEVVDHRTFAWNCSEWRGRPWHDVVLYELHIGAFSPEGTFAGAIAKLDHLVSLGVTAIEVMPVADFAGRWNWGYDGVLPYAPDSCYGRPEDLKALVDAAHARGLLVILDAVYNHFGPDGAYVHTLSPEMFTARHETPWGKGINTDGPGSFETRAFLIEAAVSWIVDYRVDGLRLDAVHAIRDASSVHFLTELAQAVRAAAGDRYVHLILENEENEASRLAPAGPYTAQWNDDVHHVLHAAVTREGSGYYADYLGDTQKLGRALAEGFAFQGEVMRFRNSARGEDSTLLPPSAFVAFLQNHDQVGNRPRGERLLSLASDEAFRAAAAIYLLLPQVPMLFMGEEWGTRRSFPYFCDFEGELAAAVRSGRRAELERCPDGGADAPDPISADTFLTAKLDWNEPRTPAHGAWLEWYRSVLAVRRAEIVPLMTAFRRAGTHDVVGEGAVAVRWSTARGDLLLLANLSERAVTGFPADLARVIWSEGTAENTAEGGRLGPWTVRWSVADA